MSEDMEDGETALTPEELEVMRSEPIGRQPFHIQKTGMPPGNPNHVSATEAQTRREEIASLGSAEAAQRAWARANAVRAKRHGPGANGKSQPGGRARPKGPGDATDFGPSPMAGATQSKTKGKDRKEIEKWSRSVQFAHAMIALKLQRQEFAISDEEAFLLTEAVVDVMEYYNIKLKGTAGAWGALIYAVGMVYGPRVAGLVIERMQAAQPAQAPQQQPPHQTAPVGGWQANNG